MRENNISPAVTEGDTASSVFINPNTTNGCLPISVIIQPVEFAINGKNIAQTITFKYKVFSQIPSFLILLPPYNPHRIIALPAPTIALKLQNNVLTGGI